MLRDLLIKAEEASYASSKKPLTEKIRETFPTLTKGVEVFDFYRVELVVPFDESSTPKWAATVDGVLLTHLESSDEWLAALPELLDSTEVLVVGPPMIEKGFLTGTLTLEEDPSFSATYVLFPGTTDIDPELALVNALEKLREEKRKLRKTEIDGDGKMNVAKSRFDEFEKKVREEWARLIDTPQP